MSTNPPIDDKLVVRAMKLGGHRTKEAAVTQALTDYICRLEQEGVISLFGSVDYAPQYDWKKQRSRG